MCVNRMYTQLGKKLWEKSTCDSTEPKAKSQNVTKMLQNDTKMLQKNATKSKILAPKCYKKNANQRFWLENAAIARKTAPD